MSENKGLNEAREMIERYYWGDSEKQLLIPVFGGLLNYHNIEKIAPIIMELLNDDPLVEQITNFYGKGQSLWFALANKIERK